MAELGTLSRGQLAHYIAAPGKTSYDRLAKGISDLGSQLNPKKQEATYIDDSSESTVTAYQPTWPVTASKYNKSPANKLLYDMAWNEKKGDDAIVEHVIVQRDQPSTADPDTYKAAKHSCSWIPESSGGGAGGETVVYSGSLERKGDMTHGWATIVVDPDTKLETCTFSETEPV